MWIRERVWINLKPEAFLYTSVESGYNPEYLDNTRTNWHSIIWPMLVEYAKYYTEIVSVPGLLLDWYMYTHAYSSMCK